MTSTNSLPLDDEPAELPRKSDSAPIPRGTRVERIDFGRRDEASPAQATPDRAGAPGLKVVVGASPGRGRGVFALAEIAPGELIERAPVIVIPGAQEADLDRTVLYNYTFAWEPEPQGSAIALGCGSIYNHAQAANARYEKRTELGVIDFIATRQIWPGDEVFVNYNGDGDPEEPVWFDLAP